LAGVPENRRVLVATIAPRSGGVPTMARFTCDTLADRGYEPVVAWYEPRSQSPELSVPAYAVLGGRRVRARDEISFGRYEGHAVGAWLPELEFTHYHATALWRRLVESCRYHLVVSGNCLAGKAYVDLGLPFLSWIATPWDADRQERVREFPLPRRLLDKLVNAPTIRRWERRILNAGTTLALSQYTERKLAQNAGKALAGVLPMPVDGALFRPATESVIPGRIGFSGRFSDPRKNIGLLLEAVACARRLGLQLSVDLIGESNPQFIRPLLENTGVADIVHVHPYVSREQLSQLLQQLDVFVVPSHQEGLCIAALEAMACGCPVISTRCGGPEEYVTYGETGFLVEADPVRMGEAISRVVEDRVLRSRLADGAREVIASRYTPAVARQRFIETFDRVYNGAGA
jgi:glycosyltransferase involved in cell wall biosynthesis